MTDRPDTIPDVIDDDESPAVLADQTPTPDVDPDVITAEDNDEDVTP